MISVQTWSRSNNEYMEVFRLDRSKDPRLASLPETLRFAKAGAAEEVIRQATGMDIPRSKAPPLGTPFVIEQSCKDAKKFVEHMKKEQRCLNGNDVTIWSIESLEDDRYSVTLRLPVASSLIPPQGEAPPPQPGLLSPLQQQHAGGSAGSSAEHAGKRPLEDAARGGAPRLAPALRAPPMQPQPPIGKDVETGRAGSSRAPPQGSEPPSPKRARGGDEEEVATHGQAGRRCTVLTNFAQIRVKSDLQVFQFDVRFEPPIAKAENRRRVLSECKMDSLLAGSPGASGVAYDGNAILYVANGALQLSSEAARQGWVDENGELGFTRQEAGRKPLQLTLKRAGGDAVLRNFGDFMTKAGGDDVRAHQMALEVVLKHQACTRFKALGDAFYDETCEASWADQRRLVSGSSLPSSLWLGYRSTIVRTENGPALHVDRAVSCMLAPLELIDFLAKKLRLRDARDLRLDRPGTVASDYSVVGGEHAKVGGALVSALTRKLTEGTRRLRVMSRHKMGGPRSNTPTMTYTVRGLDAVRADKAFFAEACGRCAPCNATRVAGARPSSEQCESPHRISVFDWFGREFRSFPLRRPDLPCLCCGPQTNPRKLLLPLELASILPGQPQQEVGPDLVAEMITQTCIWPHERMPLIKSVVRDEYSERADPAKTTTSRAFGMRVAPEAGEIGAPPPDGGGRPGVLVTTTGRVLEPCSMLYGNQKVEGRDIRNGAWNLRSTAFQRGGKCSGFAIVHCEPPHHGSFQAGVFIETLRRVARERNMPLAGARGSSAKRSTRARRCGSTISSPSSRER